MDEFEMAFFYGDFTALRDIATSLLSEDSDNSDAHNENFVFDSED